MPQNQDQPDRRAITHPGNATAPVPADQPEIQGRLDLLNFQRTIDLTGQCASLLDEATAAGEAMALAIARKPRAKANLLRRCSDCHPQTIAVMQDPRRSGSALMSSSAYRRA
jgi:glycine dehydrogenase